MMLEQYLQILDKFREDDIALLLKNQRESILHILQSVKFNSKISAYFTTIQLGGEPFSDFATQPKPIWQIKQIVNALYHAELAFTDLQSVNLRDGNNKIQDIQKLCGQTIEHGYQASYLLTNLDIDLLAGLDAEVAPLIQSLNKELQPMIILMASSFAKIFNNNHECPIEAMFGNLELSQNSTPYNIGFISAMLLEQGNAFASGDYKGIAKLSVDFAQYLQQLTEYLREFIPPIATYQPTLDATKLQDLQRTATMLFGAIENLQRQNAFLSLKIVYYFRMMRQIIALCLNIIERVGYMNETSQDFIRSKMYVLKNEYLLGLLNLSDRLEMEAMFAPGTLSAPLMQKIQPLYESLGTYLAKFVNFNAAGEDLLSLNDAHFKQLRLQHLQQRQIELRWELFEHTCAEEAWDAFFNQENTSHSLPTASPELRNKFLNSYKFLHPYVKKIDPELDNILISSLTHEQKPEDVGWFSWLQTPLIWLGVQSELLSNETLNNLKTKLKLEITKGQNTCDFYNKLNTDILANLQSENPRNVFALKDFASDLFKVDEAAILDINVEFNNQLTFAPGRVLGSVIVNNPYLLNATQAKTLYFYYEKMLTSLNVARIAFRQFLEMSRQEASLESASAEVKRSLCKIYAQFQAYLITSFPDMEKNQAHLLDLQITNSLREYPQPRCLGNGNLRQPSIDQPTLTLIETKFHVLDLFYQTQLSTYKTLAEAKYRLEVQGTTLILANNERLNFVIKDTKYSQAVIELRQMLKKMLIFFNNTLLSKLQEASPGLPFPDLELSGSIPWETVPEQALYLQVIANSLYYLEQICLELEQLNHKSWKWQYVYHLIKVNEYRKKVMGNAKILANNPYNLFLFQGLKDIANTFGDILVPQFQPYLDNQAFILEQQLIKRPIIWHGLHTLFLLPEQLQTILTNESLTTTKRDVIRKRARNAVINFQYIMRNSNSSLKLFFYLPKMYSLWGELTQTCKDLGGLSHSVMVKNLQTINEDIFQRILLEADEWEDKLALKPGLLVDPLFLILDEFYKGLLDNLTIENKDYLAFITNLTPTKIRITHACRVKTALLEKIAASSANVGTLKSLQFARDTATERLLYLEELKNKQEKLHDLFTQKYSANFFADKIKLPCTQKLRYLEGEYQKVFKKYILTYKMSILNDAHQNSDPLATILNSITVKAIRFADVHMDAYLQLDNVMDCLAEFQRYILTAQQQIQQGSSSFENKDTLAQKIRIIEDLTKIALSNKSVAIRLASIKAKVNAASFSHTLLVVTKPSGFTFSWLKQCIMRLLAVLHISTIKHEELTSRLRQTLNPVPNSLFHQGKDNAALTKSSAWVPNFFASSGSQAPRQESPSVDGLAQLRR